MNNAIDDLLNIYAYWWASGAADPADRAREEESCRLAEEALRKQEGMKPVRTDDYYTEYICQMCEKTMDVESSPTKPTRCPYCGQKLNWEE